MNRYRIFSPNLQELPVWKDFADAVDSVFKDKIDDPQVVMRLLRNTFAFGPTAYGEATPSGTFDISDLYNFHGPATNQTYDVTGVPQSVFILPLTIPTGYPDQNRILVYQKATPAPDSDYVFVSPSSYNINSISQIQFYGPVAVGQTVKVVLKPHSVELTRKLNQLGFIYNDVDFVSLPTEYENSDAIQVLSDLIGNYYIHSKGTKNFADFFGYCFKAIFRVEQLWSYENGNDEYPTLVPDGSPLIGTPVTEGGTWYPTSHVKLYYDMLKFGNSLNERAVKDFFLYISPINLVVVAVVLEAQLDVGPLYYWAEPTMTIHYL